MQYNTTNRPIRMLPLLVCVVIAGCSAMRGPNDADRLIQSRQLTMQGMNAAQEGRADDAEALFKQAIAICKVDERPHLQRAKLFWSQQKYDQAIQEMEEAVRLSAGEPSRRIQLGKMYLELDRLAQAQGQARRAISTGNSAAAWILRAQVLHRQQKLSEALAAYQRALSATPNQGALARQAQLAIADIYRETNRSHLSLAVLDRWLEENPDLVAGKVLHRRGLALQSLQRHREAAICLSKAARQEGNNAVLLYDLAQSQFQSGDVIGARLSVQQALRIAPRMPQAINLAQRLEKEPPSIARRP